MNAMLVPLFRSNMEQHPNFCVAFHMNLLPQLTAMELRGNRPQSILTE